MVTAEDFNGYPAVLVQLDKVTKRALEAALEHAHAAAAAAARS